MKKFSLFYHIPSKKDYLSSEKSIETDNALDISSYIKKMAGGKDSVTLFYNEKASKIKIWKSDKKKGYELEIISSNGILEYEGTLIENELHDLIGKAVDDFDNIFYSPEKYGFSYGSI